MKAVYVVGQYVGATVKDIFRKRKWLVVNHINNASLVVFTGGADISPNLYNEQRNRKTYASPQRDEEEVKIFESCRKLGIDMAGICRGGQLLNVLNGGSMWQHADGHTSTHQIDDIDLDEPLKVTSTHHQIMKPTYDALIIATAKESTYYEGAESDKQIIPDIDDKEVEVCFYEETRCLCFQPHPEYGHEPTETYFFDVIDRYGLGERK